MGVGIEALTQGLSRRLLAPVVDETGADGSYDYKVSWGPENPFPPRAGFVVDPAVLSQALQEQLGLQLEARPVSVDTLNVVSAKPPEDVVTKRPSA
jgi:uncharacterized protein (TIGR03435 family)